MDVQQKRLANIERLWVFFSNMEPIDATKSTEIERRVSQLEEQYSCLDRDILHECQQMREDILQLQKYLLKDLSRHNMLSGRSKNLTTSLFIQLNNILDKGYARFVCAIHNANSSEGEEMKECYFPVANSELALKKKWRSEHPRILYDMLSTYDVKRCFKDTCLQLVNARQLSELLVESGVNLIGDGKSGKPTDAILHSDFFDNLPLKAHPLISILRERMATGRLPISLKELYGYIRDVKNTLKDEAKRIRSDSSLPKWIKVKKDWIVLILKWLLDSKILSAETGRDADTSQNEDEVLKWMQLDMTRVTDFSGLPDSLKGYKTWIEIGIEHCTAQLRKLSVHNFPDVYDLLLQAGDYYHFYKGDTKNAWLNCVRDVNNESKHIRLTPQQCSRNLEQQVAYLSQNHTRVLLEYVEQSLNGWSFANAFEDSGVVDSRKAAEYSRLLMRFLRKKKVIGDWRDQAKNRRRKKRTRPFVTVIALEVESMLMCIRCEDERGVRAQQQALYMKIRDLLKKENVEPFLRKERLECEVEAELFEKAAANVTEILIRRAYHRGHLSFQPDQRVEIIPLLERGVEEVERIMIALAHAREKICASSDKVPMIIPGVVLEEEGSCWIARLNKEVIQQSQDIVEIEVDILLHTNGLESGAVETARQIHVLKRFIHDCKYMGGAAAKLAHVYEHLGDIWLAHHAYDTSQRCFYNAAIWTHGEEDETLRLLRIRKAKARVADALSLQYFRSEQDLASEYSSCQQIWISLQSSLQTAVRNARRDGENCVLQVHEYEWTDVVDHVSKLAIKMRHTLDQALKRYVKRAIYWPNSIYGDVQINFPYAHNDSALCEQLEKHNAEYLCEQEHSAVYELIKEMQPFGNSQWWGNLVVLSNSLKHAGVQFALNSSKSFDEALVWKFRGGANPEMCSVFPIFEEGLEAVRHVLREIILRLPREIESRVPDACVIDLHITDSTTVGDTISHDAAPPPPVVPEVLHSMDYCLSGDSEELRVVERILYGWLFHCSITHLRSCNVEERDRWKQKIENLDRMAQHYGMRCGNVAIWDEWMGGNSDNVFDAVVRQLEREGIMVDEAGKSVLDVYQLRHFAAIHISQRLGEFPKFAQLASNPEDESVWMLPKSQMEMVDEVFRAIEKILNDLPAVLIGERKEPSLFDVD